MAAVTRHQRRRDTQQTPVPPAPATSETEASVEPVPPASGGFFEPERRRAMISEAAYYLSERRGFCPGCELDDWLAAESEIDRVLTSGDPASRDRS